MTTPHICKRARTFPFTRFEELNLVIVIQKYLHSSIDYALRQSDSVARKAVAHNRFKAEIQMKVIPLTQKPVYYNTGGRWTRQSDGGRDVAKGNRKWWNNGWPWRLSARKAHVGRKIRGLDHQLGSGRQTDRQTDGRTASWRHTVMQQPVIG